MKYIFIFLLTSITFIFSQESTSNSGYRNAHSMVYHDQENAIYLFGGASDSKVLNDLWKFQNGQWTQIETKYFSVRTNIC